MLKIVARLTVREEKIDEFKQVAEDLIKKSNAEEANIFYTLNQSVEDEQQFAFIECWRDEEALKLHEASEHFTKTFPLLGALCESSEPVNIYREVEY